MDEVTWGALALTLTLVGALYTWWAFTRRGAASGTRGAALTLLPAAAWLTGTLEMFTEIAGSVSDWATHLVLSPVVWSGIGLAGCSVLLFLVSGTLRERELRRGGREGGAGRARRETRGKESRDALPRGAEPRQEPVVDDDMAEIEALLRRRGIE